MVTLSRGNQVFYRKEGKFGIVLKFCTKIGKYSNKMEQQILLLPIDPPHKNQHWLVGGVLRTLRGLIYLSLSLC